MKFFAYQNKKAHDYFEGYYVRIYNETYNYAFIMAVTKYTKDPHAFLQIFNGKTHENTYIRYDADTFYESSGTIYVGPNRLSIDQLIIDTPKLSLEATLTNHIVLDKSAMAYLRKLPLECYQEVLMLDGAFKGKLTLDNQAMSLEGKAYMEKTYGKQFPQAWFWIQANDFNQPLAISMAGGDIPLPLTKKTRFGFFVLLWYKGTLYRFGSFNFAKLTFDQNGAQKLTIKRKKRTLKIELTPAKATLLKGPSKGGDMILDVYESLNAQLKVRLYEADELIIEAQSKHVGMEWMHL